MIAPSFRIPHSAFCIVALAAFAASAADLFGGKAPTETVEVPADLKTGEFVLTFDATFSKGAPRQFLLRQYFTCDNGARDLYTHIGFAGENGRLYVYSTDNPALLSHDIRVAVRENGVKLHSHTVVSDLAVRAVGAHGIFAGWRATPTIDIRISDCVFENCSFTGNRTVNVGVWHGTCYRDFREKYNE